MDNCRWCGKELTHIEGRRKKTFCNGTCRYYHWKQAKKEKKTRMVTIKEWDEAQRKIREIEGAPEGTIFKFYNPIKKASEIPAEILPEIPKDIPGSDKLSILRNR